MNAFAGINFANIGRTTGGDNHALYGQGARFDHARALTEDEIRRAAPSIFAVDAHESRSARFQPIPTIEVLRGLAREGFSTVAVAQSRSRDIGKRDYTKHMVRLRRLDDGQEYKVGDSVFEICLKNANDGTAAYDLIGGVFRIRCLNSLVSQIGTADSVKVRHSGSAEAIQGKVIEGTYSVLKTAETVMRAPADWQTLIMNRDETQILAEAAHALRFGEQEIDEETGRKVGQTIDPLRLLAPRRRDDVANDLWTQFNVVQENVIRGGIKGVTINAETGQRRRSQSREVKGVDQDIKLNRALWILGERMAELKGLKAA